jgi:hypothetical protein
VNFQMNFQSLIQLIQQHLTVSLFLVAVAFFGLRLLIARHGIYAWYYLVIAAALTGSFISDHPAYFYVFLLGGATAFAEIISKFSSEPLKALKTPHAFVYHLLNGGIAVFALKVIYLYSPADAPPLDQLKNVVIAGLGSMLMMRSKLFNIKVSGEDVSFGPEQIVKIFFRFMEDAIDRVRARYRIDFVKKTLGNINFSSVYEYSLTMLLAAQALDKDRKEACKQEIIKINSGEPNDIQLRSYMLGFTLMNEMGEDYVTELFGKPETHWLISAPKPAEKTDGVFPQIVNVNNAALSALPFFGKKEASVPYFAYGSSMCERKFLERLVWKDEEKSQFKEMHPRAVELRGYRLAFNKQREDGMPGEGAPNLVPAPDESVEGVLYQLPQVAADFLSKTEKGYHSIIVKIQVEGKDIEAMAYEADAESSNDGLKPTKEMLDVMKEGAREHQLSETYISKLDNYETLPTDYAPVPSSNSLIVQSGNSGATM